MDFLSFPKAIVGIPHQLFPLSLSLLLSFLSFLAVHIHAAALNELGTLTYLKGDFELGYSYYQKSLAIVPRCTNTLIKVKTTLTPNPNPHLNPTGVVVYL